MSLCHYFVIPEKEIQSRTCSCPFPSQSLQTNKTCLLTNSLLFPFVFLSCLVSFTGSAQLQIMGFNTDLYKNMSEASKRPHGLVSISLLIQVRILYEHLILLFFFWVLSRKIYKWRIGWQKKSNSNIRNLTALRIKPHHIETSLFPSCNFFHSEL